jgi:probable DNA repair protein
VSPAGVATAAARSWSRLHDYLVPFESLDAEESPETAAFARWCRRFRRLLEEHGWIEGAQAASRVHPDAARPGLEMVGFDRLTPLQQTLLERWATAGLEINRADPPAACGTVRRVSCLDAVAEIEAAARWAAVRLDGKPELRLAIVVPDLARDRAQVRRIVERVLVPDAGLTGGPDPETRAFELAAARPLSEQPVIAAALELLDAFVRRRDLPAVSRLLLDPFLAGAARERDARARLDAHFRRVAGPGFGLGGVERMAAERGCPSLATALAEGARVVASWPEKSLPSVCSKKIIELLSALGWPGVAPGSAEHQAAERWRTLVAEFGACDEFTGPVTREEAAGHVRERAGSSLFEPQAMRAPLLVIDPETSAGMRFDALWMTGLDAARWPPPAAPDPFLPRTEQMRRGVPRASAELAAQEARRLLNRLVASAPEVVLSVAEMEDEATVLPSPLLDGIATLESPAYWPEARLALEQFTRRPLLESRVDAALPAITAEEARRGGARLLELQSACPFRAQAEVRLAARALEEPAAGVDAAERGDLVHSALAQLWHELRRQEALLELDAAGIEAVVQRAVSAALVEARRTPDPVLRHLLDLEAEWLADRVREMVDADRARPPFQVEGVEHDATARIGALELSLRLDRVDRLADGSLAVIDYKTGASAEVNAWLDERPRLPQLPAYVQALGPERVGAVAFARVRSGSTGYVGLARSADVFPGLKVPGTKGGPRDYGSWDELLGAWRRRLEVLAEEYAAGDARLAPDPRRACLYCHLGALCRIAEASPAEPGDDDDDA